MKQLMQQAICGARVMSNMLSRQLSEGVGLHYFCSTLPPQKSLTYFIVAHLHAEHSLHHSPSLHPLNQIHSLRDGGLATNHTHWALQGAPVGLGSISVPTSVGNLAVSQQRPGRRRRGRGSSMSRRNPAVPATSTGGGYKLEQPPPFLSKTFALHLPCFASDAKTLHIAFDACSLMTQQL